jgi:hypothetical protein
VKAGDEAAANEANPESPFCHPSGSPLTMSERTIPYLLS